MINRFILILRLNFRVLLSDIILYFSFVFDFDLIMLAILSPYYTLNTISTYSRSAAISVQFIIFNNLVNLDLGLTYACQANLSLMIFIFCCIPNPSSFMTNS